MTHVGLFWKGGGGYYDLAETQEQLKAIEPVETAESQAQDCKSCKKLRID